MPRLSSHLLRFVIIGTFILLGSCSNRSTPLPNSVAEVTTDPSSISDASPVKTSESDWPAWRGPKGNGLATGKEIPVKWDDTTNVAWRSAIPGRGHSSPIVVGSVVYLATAIEEKQLQEVIAFDRTTGKQLWETVVHEGGFPSPSESHEKSTHANPTLASDGRLLFAPFLNSSRIFVTALDTAGKKVWQQDLGPFSCKFGYAPSPVIYKSFVIIAADNQGGGFIAALHRDTGKVIWRKQRPAIATYSTPLLASIDGRDQLIISGCHQLVSYDPANGKEHWSCKATVEATCGTMVTDGFHVFASGGFPERETVCVKGNGSGETVWSNKTKVYEPSMIVVGEHLFAVTDDGIAWCWAAKTGKVLWNKRLGGSFSASPVFCNGMIYVPNLSGDTYVFEAKGDAYHEVARNHLGDDSYSSIAVSGSDLFMRVGVGEGAERKEQLVCLRKQ